MDTIVPSRQPHLLVVINGNIGEWRETFTLSPDRPRLPLPYAFGAATINAGFKLSAIDVGAKTRQSAAESSDTAPFHTVFPANELAAALRATDVALLWGRLGVSAALKQVFLPRPRRRVFYFSYVWEPQGTSSLRQRGQLGIVRQAARLTRGVVLMTARQVEAARAMLPRHVSVVDLQVGIDCGFYARPSSLSDIAEADRARVERVLQSPYVIMPGDELRLNDDALAIVEGSQLSLVRISQYGHKSGITELKTAIRHRNLADRLLVLERISYPAMRFLMSRAVAYAGLVDATWQPAGWTVACESLASGLPVVLYEGLTSTELKRLGAGPNIVRSVPMRDTKAFASELQSLLTAHRKSEIETDARTFAAERLNLETTGAVFGERLAKALRAG